MTPVHDHGYQHDSAQNYETQRSIHIISLFPPPPLPHLLDVSVDVQVSITTIYFGFLVSVYAVAGLVHPREIYCLLHGVWYLLCLPSGYLILTIYSICNLTDSSWGRWPMKIINSCKLCLPKEIREYNALHLPMQITVLCQKQIQISSQGLTKFAFGVLRRWKLKHTFCV